MTQSIHLHFRILGLFPPHYMITYILLKIVLFPSSIRYGPQTKENKGGKSTKKKKKNHTHTHTHTHENKQNKETKKKKTSKNQNNQNEKQD